MFPALGLHLETLAAQTCHALGLLNKEQVVSSQLLIAPIKSCSLNGVVRITIFKTVINILCLSLFDVCYLSTSGSNAVVPIVSERERVLAQWAAFNAARPMLPSGKRSRANPSRVVDLDEMVDSSRHQTAASSASQSFTERMRATNPPRVRPNALQSPDSPMAGEVSEDNDVGRERVLAEFAAYNARSTAAKETSRQKKKILKQLPIITDT